MRLQAKKALSDLTARPARTLLTLVGLVLGLWGLGSTLIAQRVLSGDLQANYTGTLPPDLVVRTNELPQSARQALDALPEVAVIEDRPQAVVRIATGPDTWLPLVLFFVEDFTSMGVAQFRIDEGDWPPADGSLLIERDGLTLLRFFGSPSPQPSGHGAHGGPRPALPTPTADQWRIQLPDGRELNVPRTGTVFDPGQAPSRMELTLYGYVSAATAQQWFDSLPTRLLVRLKGAPDDAGRLEAVNRIEGVLADEGIQGHEIVINDRNQHPHQFQLNTLLICLLALGGAGLILSAVLVVNLINAILTNQIRQIGSLKAVGATSRQVGFIYLLSMLTLGLLAALIAAPLARSTGYGLASILTAMLNFELQTSALSWSWYGAMILAGALFPVLAAAGPVLKWSRRPVAAALANHGASDPSTERSLIDRLPLPLPLALRCGVRNALRRPLRFTLSAATMAIGAIAFLLAMNLRASLLHTAEVQEDEIAWDLAANFSEPVSRSRIAWIEQFPWAAGLEMWNTERVTVDQRPRTGSPSYPLVAMPAESAVWQPAVVEGRWLQSGRTEVVVTHRFLDHYPDLAIGDEVGFSRNGQHLMARIVGTVKAFGPATLYMDRDAYAELTGMSTDTGNRALVTLAADADTGLREASALLDSHFAMVDIGVRSIGFSRMASRIIRNHLAIIEVMLGIMAVLMIVIAGLGLASGMATSIVERTREIGVLRAVGARRRQVLSLLSAESIFTAVAGWVLAIMIAPTLSRAVNAWFGAGLVEYPFDYATSWSGMGLALITAVVLATIATVAAARSAMGGNIAHKVAYE